MSNVDRRGADRYPPPKPVPATFGGFDARIVDIGLVGCRIEHADRLPPRARLALKFSWRGASVRIDGTVVRSELISINGRPAYVSGLQFCESAEASPLVIRDIVGWLVAATKKSEPEEEELEEEVEVLSAKYLRCTLAAGQWAKVFVDDPAQPGEGFTIRAPENEREADVLCRAYERADAEKRQAMRAAFRRELAR